MQRKVPFERVLRAVEEFFSWGWMYWGLLPSPPQSLLASLMLPCAANTKNLEIGISIASVDIWTIRLHIFSDDCISNKSPLAVSVPDTLEAARAKFVPEPDLGAGDEQPANNNLLFLNDVLRTNNNVLTLYMPLLFWCSLMEANALWLSSFFLR